VTRLQNEKRSRAQRSLLSFSSLATVLSTIAAYPALAQQAPVTVPTREDLEPVQPLKEAPKPRVTVDGDVETAPCALDDPAYAKIKIKISSASFNNLGPVPASELADTYSSYLGSEQSINIVCRIRDAAATKLRSKGYIAAVQVPTQRIENGAVIFEVLYAKVTSIRVVGKAGRNKRLIESYLSKLADGELFNRFTAERYLLLARDIPGYDVRLSLKPASTGPGEMIAEITLRRTPVIVDFSTQNFAAASTGRIGGQVRATFNGLTGMGDRTTVSAYATSDFSEQKIFQFSHEMLLGSNGLRLGGRGNFALTRPSLGPTVPDVSAKSIYANAELSYPLVRRLAITIRAAAGFDFVDQKVRFSGAPLSEDRLRIAYFRLDTDATDLKGVGPKGSVGWRLNGSIEARKGLNILRASPNCLKLPLVCGANGFVAPSLPDGDPTANVFRISANAELRPAHGIAVSISPRAQTGSASLFAFEQFSTGNYSIGRGFDPGALVGDKGAGFQTEVRLDSFRLRPKSILELQPYVFSDNAWIWNEGALVRNPQRLSSVGGGVRIDIARRGRFDLSVGIPRTILPGETKRRSPRFLASFSTTLLPWSKL
jgi:hemolysin activation/secretion protein